MLAFRAAAPEDAGLITRFIQGMAAAQGFAERATTDARRTAWLVFEAQAALTCEIVERDGVPVGFLVWQPFASTFRGKLGMYLEDIYVEPACRGQGIGRAIMAHLARICRARGFYALQWSVLGTNDRAQRFYASLGATADAEWQTLSLDGLALEALAGPAP
jgi:GNAT superfamily N-acetyltransferase